MNNSTLYMAIIALLGLVLGAALVCEFVGSDKSQEKPAGEGSPTSRTGASSNVVGDGETVEARENLKYGELNWQKKPEKEKKAQPAKARSSYERERELVKPEGAEGNPVR
jgi:hypothetical protein